jgi:hypothetical protein
MEEVKMIRNGFIRIMNGMWITTTDLHSIRVVRVEEDEGKQWAIYGTWIVDVDDIDLTIEGNFESMEDAQRALDGYMRK